MLSPLTLYMVISKPLTVVVGGRVSGFCRRVVYGGPDLGINRVYAC